MNENNTWKVQVGKGKKGSYQTRYIFFDNEEWKAKFYYSCINIGNGYKKRLVHSLAEAKQNKIICREFS